MDVLSQEHVGNGLGQNAQVEPKRSAANVFDIQRLTAFPRYVVAAADLGEAGKPWLHGQLPLLDFRVETDLVELIWPRAHQGHVTSKNVEELRQFVQAGPSEEAPDRSHAWI